MRGISTSHQKQVTRLHNKIAKLLPKSCETIPCGGVRAPSIRCFDGTGRIAQDNRFFEEIKPNHKKIKDKKLRVKNCSAVRLKLQLYAMHFISFDGFQKILKAAERLEHNSTEFERPEDRISVETKAAPGRMPNWIDAQERTVLTPFCRRARTHPPEMPIQKSISR